ncbi:MAG TPA: CpsD/CapB family tyrosine-protein kinase [Candidatus Mediterraneibacter intestinipullorum]|nr:CpsD/CapB family tyrosine-protein kinase [Candidatus Mediterraneibacter intestinipullorum]
MTEPKVVMTDPKRPDYFYEEAIKTLRTNVQFAGTRIRTIVLTSCYPNEGKSDIVFQLAAEMGKIGKRILILDADIRKSSFVKRFQVKGKIAGLSQYLSGQCEMEDIIYNTNFTGVDMIFSGPVAPNPSELLGQETFTELLHGLRKKYDYVLIDTPPVANLIDAAVVAGRCDGAILVIESDLVSRKVAAKAKEQLEISGCRVLGAVLNKVDVRKNKYYSKYGYYGRTEGK